VKCRLPREFSAEDRKSLLYHPIIVIGGGKKRGNTLAIARKKIQGKDYSLHSRVKGTWFAYILNSAGKRGKGTYFPLYDEGKKAHNFTFLFCGGGKKGLKMQGDGRFMSEFGFQSWKLEMRTIIEGEKKKGKQAHPPNK